MLLEALAGYLAPRPRAGAHVVQVLGLLGFLVGDFSLETSRWRLLVGGFWLQAPGWDPTSAASKTHCESYGRSWWRGPGSVPKPLEDLREYRLEPKFGEVLEESRHTGFAITSSALVVLFAAS